MASSGIVGVVADSQQAGSKVGLAVHAAGWSLLWAVYFLLDVPKANHNDVAMLAVRAAVWAVGGLLVSLLLERVYAALGLAEHNSGVWFGVATGGSLVGAALWLVAFTAFDGEVGLEPGFEPMLDRGTRSILTEYMSFVFPLLAWQGVVRSAGQAQRVQLAEAQAARAEREATEAKLGALRHQLNPHFLFNALNSAVELTRVEPEAAEQMLLDLSALLRETLKAPTGTHALRDELALVQRYLGIETRRFGDRLRFCLDDQTVGHAGALVQVPVLAVHVLVENAVKHGLRGSTDPLELRLRVQQIDDTLRIEVENTGTLRDHDPSRDTGLGLANLRERLSVTHPQRHQFFLEDTESDGVAFVRARLDLEGAPR